VKRGNASFCFDRLAFMLLPTLRFSFSAFGRKLRWCREYLLSQNCCGFVSHRGRQFEVPVLRDTMPQRVRALQNSHFMEGKL